MKKITLTLCLIILMLVCLLSASMIVNVEQAINQSSATQTYGAEQYHLQLTEISR